MDRTQNLLSSRKLRNTTIRKAVLDLFIQNDFALSQPFLEKELGETADRVTIYRTLGVFLEKGLIHKVVSETGSAKYAICPDFCNENSHNHSHLHFTCSQCAHTFCMKTPVPVINIPSEHLIEEISVHVRGICNKCKKGKA